MINKTKQIDMKFICFSKAKEQFNCNDESLGIGHDRAVYYLPSVGKHRLYRSSFPVLDAINKNLKLLIFKDKDKAQSCCDDTNEIFNDDFVVMQID